MLSDFSTSNQGRREEAYWKRKALGIAGADKAIDDMAQTDQFVKSIMFKVDWEEGGWLGVIKRTGPSGDEIAFHRDVEFIDAVCGVVERLRNGSLKWRKDTPYGS